MVRISVTIPQDILGELKDAARGYGLSVSAYLRMAGLECQRRKRIGGGGKPR